MKVDIYSTNKKYDIIYTDPPWQQKKGGKKKARPNSSGMGLDYPTMNLQDIIALHSDVLGNLTNDTHNVFMWTIDKYLLETEKFMAALGYSLHARIVWHKVTGMAPAFTMRYTNEYLLWFYRKGHILMPAEHCRGKYANFILEKVKKHSQKPEAAYTMLEDMFPGGERLELFARSNRSGWDCWGNETPDTESDYSLQQKLNYTE